MDLSKIANDVIQTLTHERFYATCPCCGDSLRLKNAGLFFLEEFTPAAEKIYEERIADLRARAKELRDEKKAIGRRAQVGAKSVNIGFILERLVPAMKSFRFSQNDCRSLFDPIDYVIFEGLSKGGKVTRIIFTEIKSGNARLNNHQKEIKHVVEKKRLVWDTYEPGEKL